MSGPRIDLADEFRREEALQVLLADYTEARGDERNFLLITGTLFTVGVPLAASVSSLIFKRCSPNSLANGSCTQTPEWAFAFVPLVPLLLIGLFVLHGAIAVMRSYYLRGLEEQLGEFGATIEFGHHQPLDVLEDGPRKHRRLLKAPAFTGLILPMLSNRRGAFPNAIVQSLLYVIMGILGIGISIAALWRIENRALQLTAGIFYLLCTLVLATVAVQTGISSRAFFQSLLDKYKPFEDGIGDEQDIEASRERSLGSYLAIPRPLDLVKVCFVAGGALTAYLLSGRASRPSLVLLLAFALAFELLVYHARYMLNDFHDRNSDQTHPMPGAKRRPPRLGSGSNDLAWFEIVFFLRLILAVVVVACLFLTGHARLAWAFAIGGVLVWLFAVAYERIKVRAAAPHDPTANRGSQFLLYIWVSLGYALRIALGLIVGSLVLKFNWQGVAAIGLFAVWAAASGVMFVTMTWALESSAYFLRSDRARGPMHDVFDDRLNQRAHLGALAVSAGLLSASARPVHGLINAGAKGDQQRAVLRPDRHNHLPPTAFTIWNSALLVAAGFAGFAGAELAWAWQLDLKAGATAFAIAALSVGALATATALRAGVFGYQLVGAGLVAAATIAAEQAGASHWPLSGLALLLTILIYTYFLGTNYQTLTHPEQTTLLQLSVGAALIERGTLGEGVVSSRIAQRLASSTQNEG